MIAGFTLLALTAIRFLCANCLLVFDADVLFGTLLVAATVEQEISEHRSKARNRTTYLLKRERRRKFN
jgi:hypothetical protein